MNVGIFLPNWIGDVAMATPALRALRRRFTGDKLIGVLRPYVSEVLAGTSWLDEQILFHPKSKDPQQRTWPLIKQLRQRKLDIAVLLSNSMRTGLLAWSSGAPQRVGFVRYLRGPLLTHKLYPPRHGQRLLPTPALDSYLQLASAVGCEWESPRLELATMAEDEAAADAIWRKFRLPPGNEVVVLNSGGAFGAAKQWPAEYFAELAQRIATEQGLAVLVNCGPSERQIAAEIVRAANHARVVSLAEEPVPIGLTKACIRRSRLLVSTDSGPRFFAVAFDVPVVTLFGPMHRDWSRTHYEREVCLAHEVPCGPCMQRVCPLGHHRCMRDLTVDRVYAAARRLLAGESQAARAA
jgi:heptosyltransferase-2